MHEGHRERVREKYKLNGLDGFSSHEVLELLLFYSNKRSDTNALAHTLLKHFGSLSAVLEAPYGELMNIEGVGDATASLLTLVPELFRKYTQDKSAHVTVINSLDAAVEYLLPRFFGLTTEHIGLLCLDVKGRINNFVFISDGSLKIAQLDVRKAAQTALCNNAETIILAHNHPGGLPNPSRADVETTQSLIKTFSALNIRVSDHIIFSDGEHFSMAGCDKFAPMFMLPSTSLAPKNKFSLY